jgi:hypothetical protein
MRFRSGRGFLQVLFFLFLGILLTGCASLGKRTRSSEESVANPFKSQEKIHSFAEVNLEKVFEENRGIRILEENATTVNDYYRAGVQEKEIAERLRQQDSWGQARFHFEKSNRLLRIVVENSPDDDVALNIYGDHTVIFIPNLLLADNYLKLAGILEKMREMHKKMSSQMRIPEQMMATHDEIMQMTDKDIYWILWAGQEFLSHSLKSGKTEWGLKLLVEYEKELQRS